LKEAEQALLVAIVVLVANAVLAATPTADLPEQVQQDNPAARQGG
jgi:hypothetical protein